MSDSLMDEVNSILVNVEQTIPKALNLTAENMLGDLREHIQTNVYDAYYPQSYKRRSEDLTLGIPLNNMDENATVSISGNTLRLDYEPSGKHATQPWSADGDELIERIESANYDWRFTVTESPEPRPFFTEFLQDELANEKAADYLFFWLNKSMKDGTQIISEPGKNITVTQEDWNFYGD